MKRRDWSERVCGCEADDQTAEGAEEQRGDPRRFFFAVPDQEHQTHGCQYGASEEVLGQVLGEGRVEQTEYRVGDDQGTCTCHAEAGAEHRNGDEDREDAVDQLVVVTPLRHLDDPSELTQGLTLKRAYHIDAGQGQGAGRAG